MRTVNLTPHAVNVCSADGNVLLTIPASGIVARCVARTVRIGEVVVDGTLVPLTSTEFGEVENLPEPAEDTVYIVSTLVAQRCKERNDVVVPAESVRDAQGRIVGCTSFGRV